MKKKYLFIVCLQIFTCSFSQAQSNGVTNYTCSIPGTGQNYAWRSALAIDNNGNKWIGFNSPAASTFQLIRNNGANWDTFPHVPGKRVNALAVDAANNLWIASNGGLAMFNGSSFTYYNTGNSNISTDTILCLTIGGGKVYAGTIHGLTVFNGSTFTNYNHAINGLSHDTIYSIAYESATAIWLGNNFGFEKFYGSGFSYWYNIGGVGSDKINCIYIDQQNNKWLGTNTHGVVKFDNSSFFTMDQLYNQNTIVGGLWPKTTYSICKGPTGGVSFMLNYWVQPNNYIWAGLIEINSGQLTFYRSVASYYATNGAHSIFQHDPMSNKIYFSNTLITSQSAMLLSSFDATQYALGSDQITQSNSDFLDINNVSALITANSDMGWDEAGTKYFVPKTSKSSPLKSASLWIGGYHNGALHMAALTYRQNGMDFWSGPLDTIKDTIDVNTQSAYNRVWKINRFDIADFIYNWNAGNVQNGTFFPHPTILNWPAHGQGAYSKRLAPFVDVNGNGIYDPIHDGDYPLMKGDQMIWWVFNDNAAKHTESGGAPLGVEVQASAYAFQCPSSSDSEKVLNYTTFYNYKIINRSQNQYDSCYLSNLVEENLGNYGDDYIGTDVMNNFGYAFNGDNYDEDMDGITGYHTNLPSFACNILNGPLANAGDGRDNNNNGIIDEANEKCMLHSLSCYTIYGMYPTAPNPNNPQQYHDIMKGKWKNGTSITYGGAGTMSGNPPCKHLYPGISDPYGISMGGSISNPIAAPFPDWTQYTAVPTVVKNDMRFITGVGPFSMQPGGSYEFDYAFVFSQDSINCVSDSVCVLTRMKQDNIRVKRWFDAQNFPSCLSLSGVGVQENKNQALDVKVYPNPVSNYVYMEVADAKDKITVEIFDLIGDLVKAGVFSNSQKYIVIPVEELNAGLYSVRIRAGNAIIVKKFVKE